MGFYFKKSISFGGVRLNFSKSGIGASVGVRRFRLGTGPRGNYIHIGSNGLYYKSMVGKRRKHVESAGSNTKTFHYSDVVMQEIESSNVMDIFDSSSKNLLDEMNRKYKMFSLWTLGIVITPFLSSISNIFIGLLSVVLLFFVDKYRKTTVIIYDIEKTTEDKIQTFYETFNDIINATRAWHVSASGHVRDRKYYAGASTLIQRSNISVNYAVPKYIKTNVKVPAIPVGKQKLYFFPDKILIVQGRKIGAVSYGSLKLESYNTRFIEDGIVPRDTIIVDWTWRFVNKDGGPDRRFKNNRQIPVVLYSELYFRSETGLNELIQVSCPNVGVGLEQYLNNSDFFYTREMYANYQ